MGNFQVWKPGESTPIVNSFGPCIVPVLKGFQVVTSTVPALTRTDEGWMESSWRISTLPHRCGGQHLMMGAVTSHCLAMLMTLSRPVSHWSIFHWNRGAAATRAALRLTWFFSLKSRLSACNLQAFFVFVTFFLLLFNAPSGSLQRGWMTCSHLHPLQPQPSSGPQGFPSSCTHTHLSRCTALHLFTPPPRLSLSPSFPPSLPHMCPPSQRHTIIFCRPLCLLMTLFLITREQSRLEQEGSAALLWCLSLPSVFFPSFLLKK